jgi:ParB-like chromosome segregation protein Spo0J
MWVNIMGEPMIVEVDYSSDCEPLAGNRQFDPTRDRELLESLRKGQEVAAVGFRHPSKAGKYVIVDGNRRGAALAALGRKLRVEVRPEPFSETLGRKIRLKANNSQKRMDALDVFADAKRIMELEGFQTGRELAAYLGVHESTVSRMFRIAGLPPDLLAYSQKLCATSVRLIAGLDRSDDMKSAFERAVAEDMSKEQVELLVGQLKAGGQTGKAKQPLPVDVEVNGRRVRLWPRAGDGIDEAVKTLRAVCAKLLKNKHVPPEGWRFLFGQ